MRQCAFCGPYPSPQPIRNLDRFCRFGRPKTVRPMLSDRCRSCLSVKLVYCVQTLGWIRMPLGMVVGLNPGHIVFDRDPALPHTKGRSTPTFRPMSIVAQRSPMSATLVTQLTAHRPYTLQWSVPSFPQNCPFPWGCVPPCNRPTWPWGPSKPSTQTGSAVLQGILL